MLTEARKVPMIANRVKPDIMDVPYSGQNELIAIGPLDSKK